MKVLCGSLLFEGLVWLSGGEMYRGRAIHYYVGNRRDRNKGKRVRKERDRDGGGREKEKAWEQRKENTSAAFCDIRLIKI